MAVSVRLLLVLRCLHDGYVLPCEAADQLVFSSVPFEMSAWNAYGRDTEREDNDERSSGCMSGGSGGGGGIGNPSVPGDVGGHVYGLGLELKSLWKFEESRCVKCIA